MCRRVVCFGQCSLPKTDHLQHLLASAWPLEVSVSWYHVMSLMIHKTISSGKAGVLFRVAAAVAGGVWLVAASLQAPSSLTLTPWIKIVFFLAAFLQTLFPLRLLNSEIYFIHITILGGGLLFGGVPTAWAVVGGILLGFAVRQRWAPFRSSPPYRSWSEMWLSAGHICGRQVLALFTALYIAGFPLWVAPLTGSSGDTSPILAALALFAGLHGGLFLMDYFLSQPHDSSPNRGDMFILALIETLPLPFIYLAAAAYSAIGAGALVGVAGLPLLAAVLVSHMFSTRRYLERHLQELATLHDVSQLMRSPLDMEQLLSTIHIQVSRILHVDNFYVALYDPHKGQIWYPLAVKGALRQSWQARPLADRLTDRVILERRPVMISPSRKLPPGIEIPPGDVTPTAWIGVPLVSSDRAIGCLALYSLAAGARFSTADLELLITLSGPISVSIENALLYEQAQRRAKQLETLNSITALITASLNPHEVLEKVCLSLEQVGGGRRSAIFLFEPEDDRLWLAHAHGLSPEFIAQNSVFPVIHNGRTRCLRTGRPVLTGSLHQLTLEKDYLLSLQAENVLAIGDFPLITPEGPIGFLSVYFEREHSFQDEEVELLQTFAAHAALAVSNSRLHARTDLALSQRANQLTMLEAVGRELAKAMNSDRLFEMILTYAREFTNSPWGSLGLYNPLSSRVEIKAMAGYQEAVSSYSIQHGISGRAARLGQAVIVNDVSQDADYIDRSGGQARAQVSAPLIHEGRVLGILTLEHAQVNGYSANDLAFITQLANQAAVAVVNAELYSEAQRRLREQSILYVVSASLAGKLNLEEVLDIIPRALQAAWPVAAPGVYLWQAHEHRFRLQTTTRLPNPIAIQRHMPEHITEEDMLASGFSWDDPVPFTYLGQAASPAHLQHTCQGCQVILLPLGSQQHRIGLAVLHLPPGVPVHPTEDLQFLGAIAAQATLSLQNALLFADVSQGRNQLAAVLNSVREGIVLVEKSGLVSVVNEPARQLFNRTPEEMVGQRFPELPPAVLRICGSTLEEARDLVDDLALGRLPAYSKVTVHVEELKPERFFERVSLPVWAGSGSIIGWMIILRDVSEEQQVAQARELITETLVHDLRSPLSAVLGAIDVMDESCAELAEPAELMGQALVVARRSAKRILGMVESMLDISRMQSGSMEMNFAPLDLFAQVNLIIAEFRSQANDFGVFVTNEIPPRLPLVCADASKLSRVLTNLLDNALKFTPSGGRIVFTACLLTPEMLQVSLSDSGPGIPPEFREKIFERFSQVPGLRGRRRGSGLGLTFCKLAVDAHGGRIWVEPRPEGGSIFSFTLPLSREAI
jgi:signal transduction histidine kinase/transcriptional regulator with GAF, ATPase, and Fis domain